MPVKTLAALTAAAIAKGLDPQTPALAVARATRPDQRVVATPVADLAASLAPENLAGPVLVMIGNAVARPEHGRTRFAEPGARASNR